MAFIQCDFISEELGVSASMYVILPQTMQSQAGADMKSPDQKHPTLYLLHGLSDDHTIWLRRTSIERYVTSLGLAVVMPAVNRSFYTDMSHGYKYWSFVSEELPRIARQLFPLSDRREDNYVAGLSMGGYGALKMALRKPDQFMAAASLSGAVDIERFANNSDEAKNIFGDPNEVRGSDNDLFHLVKQVSESEGPKPMLYQCCGTEDFLYEENVKFRDYCGDLDIDLTYEEEPGEHEWGYWDMKIQNVLSWLPLNNKV